MDCLTIERRPPLRLVGLDTGKRNVLTLDGVEALKDAILALLARERLDRRRLHELTVLGRTVGPEGAAPVGFLDRLTPVRQASSSGGFRGTSNQMPSPTPRREPDSPKSAVAVWCFRPL